MGVQHRLAATAAAIFLAGCGTDSKPAEQQASETANASAPAVAEAASPANAATPAAVKAEAPPRSYTLAAKGLEPGLTFGMTQEQAVAVAASAFGAPTASEHNDECGEGPMDFVSFGDLQLGFQQGKFAGWSLGGPKPALRTAGGLAIGAPRSALGDVPIDEESSIGPEFDIGGVGGFLDEQGKVMALWAGYPCQFR